jgi:hypothetical protein
MKWLESKYISLLSNRLQLFKKKSGNLFNFRCPYCLDSQKNKHKARGYLYEKKGAYIFHCHNCGESKGFSKFLKDQDLGLYKEYMLETMREKNALEVPKEDVLELKTNKYDHEIFKDLKRICDLNVDHYAKKFVLRRKIPSKFHRELYFCEHYKTFVNNLIPNKIGGPDGPRLIIPFISYKGEVIGFTARALDDDPIRYSMIVLNEGPLAFGAHLADFNKKYYVVEGPIDSMFLDNAIAIGGSDLVTGLRRLDSNRDNAVMIFDNEPRNPEILGKIEKAINSGFSVVIWPSDLTQKDINDMILAGLSPTDLMLIIDQHTYQGMRAKMAFVTWKKRTNNAPSKSTSNSSYQANSFGVP